MFEFIVNEVTPLWYAVRPIVDMGNRANINYSDDYVMMSNVNADVTTVLLIASTRFEDFACTETSGCIGIDAREFNHALFYELGVNFLRINTDDETMYFHFIDEPRGIDDLYQMNLLQEPPYARLDPTQLVFEVKAVIGINSEQFQHFLVQLRLVEVVGVGSVNVNITHNQVVISARIDENDYALEMPECIIRGVAETDQPIQFSFGFEHMNALYHASVSSHHVWLYIPLFPGAPFMFHCPGYLDIDEMHEIDWLDDAPYFTLYTRDLTFQAQSVVGIISNVFQYYLARLSGLRTRVNVHIAHNQVVLSAGNNGTVFTLRRENGRFIIRGVEENNQPIEFSFSLEYRTAYHNTSMMSNSLWLFVPYLPGDPFMLSCPAGLLGIMSYSNQI